MDIMLDINKYLTQTHFADIEAVGFWEDVNTTDDIHCLCSVTEDDEVILWHDRPELNGAVVWDKEDEKEYIMPVRAGSLMEGFRYWYKIGQSKGKLSVHNCNQYDKPIIEKVVPKCIIPIECWRDTFVQSKVQYFDRVCPRGAKSAHGLQAYGIKFGVKKPPITDFTKFDAYILHRVIEDCRIQKKTQEYLDQEAEKLLQLGIDFTEAMLIEDEYARNCHKQEIAGVKVDVPHMKRCIEAWDKRTDELSVEIEPLLPPTVKVGSTRVTRSDMMKSLGYTKTPPDETKLVTRNGEEKLQACKPYYKPSTNFHKVEKINNYSGFNISYGESPSFVKKTELTQWIKTHHPDTKPKEWGIEKEVKETKVLNTNACKYFGVEPTDTNLICGPHTRVSFHESKLTQHEIVKGYLIRYAGLKSVDEWNLKKDKDGQIVRAEKFMIVSYPPKASPEHQLHYKVKTREPIVTSPKLGEKDYEQLVGDIGNKIGEYNTTMHRRRYLANPKDPENKGVLSYVREDGRVPAGVSNFATSTSRSSHRVIVNLPSESSLLGEEMRRCLIPEEGNVLVGADQKSSQLSIAAFVANNVEYYEAVASGKETVKDSETGEDTYLGTDAHTANAKNFNIISASEWQLAREGQDKILIHQLSLKRGKAKPCAFSVLFGAGGKKLASLLGISEQEGNHKRQAFLDQMGLSAVMDWLKLCSKKYKRGKGFYIPTAFGYWIYCNSHHKALNYLVQSMEGAVQKVAVNAFERKLIEKNLNVIKVLDMHDEMLVECKPELAKEAGELMEAAYTLAGVLLNTWFCKHLDRFSGGGVPHITPDFNGGYAIGQSYYDCH